VSAGHRDADDRDADHRDADADLRDDIRVIIAGGGPAVVFQPVVHLESSCEIGAEALARFPGTRSTGDWFARADELGLGIELELSAASAALERVDTVADERGWDFVGINVSPSLLLDERCRALAAGSDCSRVALELSAETGVAGPFAVRTRLEEMRSLGVRIAVNAVECAWPEVHRALERHPEIIKLGTDFTAALVRDPSRYDEACAILDGCRRDGAFVVAVGVEQEDELAALRRLGVDAAQGYVFGRPHA
jgi:EAL domain-containing protein (putative c-di-GMP-specific phosphodiesterase class I)